MWSKLAKYYGCLAVLYDNNKIFLFVFVFIYVFIFPKYELSEKNLCQRYSVHQWKHEVLSFVKTMLYIFAIL